MSSYPRKEILQSPKLVLKRFQGIRKSKKWISLTEGPIDSHRNHFQGFLRMGILLPSRPTSSIYTTLTIGPRGILSAGLESGEKKLSRQTKSGTEERLLVYTLDFSFIHRTDSVADWDCYDWTLDMNVPHSLQIETERQSDTHNQPHSSSQPTGTSYNKQLKISTEQHLFS